MPRASFDKAEVFPPFEQNDSLRLSQKLSATVEHTVEHTVPVDGDSLMLIPLFLLRLSADAVPVGGANTSPERHFISTYIDATLVIRLRLVARMPFAWGLRAPCAIFGA